MWRQFRGHGLCRISNWGDAILSQAKVPGLDLVLSAGRIGLEFALMDWNRKAELSCDRAALLATQDPDAVGRALCKLGGFSRKYAGELNLDEAESQAEAYTELGTDSLVIKLMKLEAMRQQTHPYPVVRVKEVRAWAKSADYQQMLQGKYRRQAPAMVAGSWTNVTVETLRGRACGKCKYPCNEDWVFCPSCQSNVRGAPLICGKCRDSVEPDWSACAGCGNWLVVSDPPPPA